MHMSLWRECWLAELLCKKALRGYHLRVNICMVHLWTSTSKRLQRVRVLSSLERKSFVLLLVGLPLLMLGSVRFIPLSWNTRSKRDPSCQVLFPMMECSQFLQWGAFVGLYWLSDPKSSQIRRLTLSFPRATSWSFELWQPPPSPTPSCSQAYTILSLTFVLGIITPVPTVEQFHGFHLNLNSILDLKVLNLFLWSLKFQMQGQSLPPFFQWLFWLL